MSIIKQTYKIFSKSLLVNLLIVVLLLSLSITIRDGIGYHQHIIQQLSQGISFKDADNYLYIHLKDFNLLEDVTPDDLSYDPIVHKIGRKAFYLDNAPQDVKFYDETLLSKCDINIVDGSMPVINSQYIEVLSVIGRNSIGDEYDVNWDNYHKIKVVGLMDKNDSLLNATLNSTRINLGSLYRNVGDDFTNYYYMVALQDPNLTIGYERNCFLEYDENIFRDNRTSIMNELNMDYSVTSMGEQYKLSEESIKSNIMESIIVSLVIFIFTIILMFIFYHNLFSLKSRIIGIYYLVGFNSKQIAGILGLLSLVHLLLYIIIYLFYLDYSYQLKLGSPLFVSFGTAILIILASFGYMMVRFITSSTVNLIKNEGDN